MSSDESKKELQILSQIITGLSSLDKEGQARMLQAAATFLNIETIVRGGKSAVSGMVSTTTAGEQAGRTATSFSGREEMSPKQFLSYKSPQSDVERVTCLAFYLTHYRDIPQFKTLDISTLNTEAAQRKFANTAYSVSNAAKRAFIVPATKGRKQLSAIGEQFVQALPDREAAEEVLQNVRRRRPRKTSRKKGKSSPKTSGAQT